MESESYYVHNLSYHNERRKSFRRYSSRIPIHATYERALWRPSQVNKLIRKADKQKDGQLDKRELQQAIQLWTNECVRRRVSRLVPNCQRLGPAPFPLHSLSAPGPTTASPRLES